MCHISKSLIPKTFLLRILSWAKLGLQAVLSSFLRQKNHRNSRSLHPPCEDLRKAIASLMVCLADASPEAVQVRSHRVVQRVGVGAHRGTWR